MTNSSSTEQIVVKCEPPDWANPQPGINPNKSSNASLLNLCEVSLSHTEKDLSTEDIKEEVKSEPVDWDNSESGNDGQVTSRSVRYSDEPGDYTAYACPMCAYSGRVARWRGRKTKWRCLPNYFCV
mgnify:CR=1 FL=1